MDNSEKGPSLQIELNNQNFTISSNINNHIDNNRPKVGEFILTPLEGFILNKKMPHGFKFEIEENLKEKKNIPKKMKLADKKIDIQKQVKIPRNQINEPKTNININKDISSNNNKKEKEKNIIIKESPQNNNNNNINYNNSESNKIMIKCYSGLNKIKSNPNSNFFYFSKTPDSPSLSKIENKIKNLEYKELNEFCDDLRKLWNYQFKNYSKNPNIYQNICKMSSLSDQICKELSNDNINNFKDEESFLSNIKKPEKPKNNSDEKNKIIKHKNFEQINKLSQLIRTLNKEELKGIIPIIIDKNENNDSKKCVFDLLLLPSEKFKKLKEYVHGCRKKNSNSNSITNNKNSNDLELKNIMNKCSNSKENNNHFANNKGEEQISFDSDSISSLSSLSN